MVCIHAAMSALQSVCNVQCAMGMVVHSMGEVCAVIFPSPPIPSLDEGWRQQRTKSSSAQEA